MKALFSQNGTEALLDIFFCSNPILNEHSVLIEEESEGCGGQANQF